jgi:hypothetical protein
MPPVMSMIVIIVVIVIVVGAIIVSARVVIVSGIVIAVVIRAIIPRPTAQHDTEALCLRIVLAKRQQSQDRQCDHEKSFHCCTSLIIGRNNSRPYSAKGTTRGR